MISTVPVLANMMIMQKAEPPLVAIRRADLNISFEEAQKVIEDYSGTGIIRVKRDGTAADVEFITCKTTLGEYFENGKWYKTKRAAIHHGKKGSHIVPIKENSCV